MLMVKKLKYYKNKGRKYILNSLNIEKVEKLTLTNKLIIHIFNQTFY